MKSSACSYVGKGFVSIQIYWILDIFETRGGGGGGGGGGHSSNVSVLVKEGVFIYWKKRAFLL